MMRSSHGSQGRPGDLHLQAGSSSSSSSSSSSAAQNLQPDGTAAGAGGAGFSSSLGRHGGVPLDTQEDTYGFVPRI